MVDTFTLFYLNKLKGEIINSYFIFPCSPSGKIHRAPGEMIPAKKLSLSSVYRFRKKHPAVIQEVLRLLSNMTNCFDTRLLLREIEIFEDKRSIFWRLFSLTISYQKFIVLTKKQNNKILFFTSEISWHGRSFKSDVINIFKPNSAIAIKISDIETLNLQTNNTNTNLTDTQAKIAKTKTNKTRLKIISTLIDIKNCYPDNILPSAINAENSQNLNISSSITEDEFSSILIDFTNDITNSNVKLSDFLSSMISRAMKIDFIYDFDEFYAVIFATLNEKLSYFFDQYKNQNIVSISSLNAKQNDNSKR